jgi:hypothetical protein
MNVRRPLSGIKSQLATSIAASATSAVTLLVIFRLSVEKTSVSSVGVWALLQGLFIVTRVAGTGLGANITRHVAVASRETGTLHLRPIVRASLILGVLPVAVLSLLCFFPIVGYVTRQFSDVVGSREIALLGLACVLSGVFSTLALALLAICEGVGRLSAGNLIVIASYAVGIATIYPALEVFSAVGIGLTYVAMAATQLGLASLLVGVLRRRSPPAVEQQTTRGVLRQLKVESTQLTAVGMLRLSFEPVTKTILSLVGALPALAAFELALRTATQVRVMVQAGSQPLLAYAARSNDANRAEISRTFEAGQSFISRLAVMTFTVELVAAPALSVAGLGGMDSTFILYFVILAGANAINSLGLMGYFFQLSSGALRPLLVIHLRMAIINLTTGLPLGFYLGGAGAVLGYASTLTYGGLCAVRLLPGRERRTFGWLEVRSQAPWLLASVAAMLWLLLTGMSESWGTTTSWVSLALTTVTAALVARNVSSAFKSVNPSLLLLSKSKTYPHPDEDQ